MTSPASETSPRRSFFGDLFEVAGDLFRYRELLAELALRDLRIRYKQAVMGVAWAILMPLVVALAGWTIRLAIGFAAGAPVPPRDLAYVAIKAVAWSFFVGALGFGTASITANLPLVTKVYFPRHILPLSAVATQIVDTGIGAIALVVILPLLGVRASPAMIWLPILLLELVLLTVAFTLLASCANVFFRDARHLVQLVVSFGIFFTPVFFNADAFGAGGAGFLLGNPLGPILEGLRLVLVDGHSLSIPLRGNQGALVWSPWLLAWSGGWALLGCAGAAVLFHRTEFAFAESV